MCGVIAHQRWYEYFRGLFNYTNFGNDEYSENFLIQHESECNIGTNDDVSIDGEILNRDVSIAEITEQDNFQTCDVKVSSHHCTRKDPGKMRVTTEVSHC